MVICQVCSNCGSMAKNDPIVGVTFYIDLHIESIKILLSETIMPSLDIWYVAPPSGRLPNLLKIVGSVAQNGSIPEVTFYIDLHNYNIKISS